MEHNNKFVMLVSEVLFYEKRQIYDYCDYTILPGNSFKFPSGFAVTKDSSLKEIFSYGSVTIKINIIICGNNSSSATDSDWDLFTY